MKFRKLILLISLLTIISSCQKKDLADGKDEIIDSVKVNINLSLESFSQNKLGAFASNPKSGTEINKNASLSSTPSNEGFVQDAHVIIVAYDAEYMTLINKIEIKIGNDSQPDLYLPVGRAYRIVAYTDNTPKNIDGVSYEYENLRYHNTAYNTNGIFSYEGYVYGVDHIVSKMAIIDQQTISRKFIPSNIPYYFGVIANTGILKRQSNYNFSLSMSQMNFGLKVKIDLTDISHSKFEIPEGVKIVSDDQKYSNHNFNKNHVRLYDGMLVPAPSVNVVDLNNSYYTPLLENDGYMTDHRVSGYNSFGTNQMEFDCFVYTPVTDFFGELVFTLKIYENDETVFYNKNFVIPNIPMIPGSRHELRLKAKYGTTINGSPELIFEKGDDINIDL